jgi:hypothetical protein
MKTITIGEWYGKLKNRNDHVAFAKLLTEAEELLGIKEYLGYDDRGVYHMAQEYGHFWLEQLSDYKDKLRKGDRHYTLIEGTKSTAPKPPGEVMCQCGNLSFYISYGSYECLGTCTQCGLMHYLYSG